MISLENKDITFFKNVLEFDNKLFEEFLNFFSDLLNLKSNIGNTTLYHFWDFVKYFISNEYNIEELDNLIEKIKMIDNIGLTIDKIESYICNNKINWEEEIDISKYYKDSNNIPEDIYYYGIKDNGVNIKSIIIYLRKCIKNDNVAFSILLEKIPLDNVEEYYNKVLETFKMICIKYKDVIRKLHDTNLVKEFYRYVMSRPNYMLEYLKANYAKKDKIYEVFSKAQELHIKNLNIHDDSKKSVNSYEVSFQHFDKAKIYTQDGYEYINDCYTGEYIYTDGLKKWLIEQKKSDKHNNKKNYAVEISNANYELICEKYLYEDDDAFIYNEYLLIGQITLEIYDFNVDVKTFPTYEELISFKVPPQVPNIENKTRAVDSILKVEDTTKNINKLINDLTDLKQKLDIIRDYPEYLDTFSHINDLISLYEQIGNLKTILCNKYFNEGIIETSDLDKLKKLRRK